MQVWTKKAFLALSNQSVVYSTIVKNSILVDYTSDKNKWAAILEYIGSYDCYHTYDYHNLNGNDKEKPILFYYKSGDSVIAFPLLKRLIPSTDFYDCTSVYGYAGPIFSKGTQRKDFNGFQSALNDFCKREKIVSIFSRLNPFIDAQEKCLEGLGNIDALGNVVNINLQKSISEQKKEFSATTKRYINKARRLCSLRESTNPEDIETFMDLYYENMRRVNADEHYYLNRNYFDNLMRSKDFETGLLFVVLDKTEEIISGIITIKVNNIVHYHLSGTKTKYLKLHPLRLMLDEARIIASTQENKYFNLGGGLGSKEDGLYLFKSSFSKEVRSFKIWKYIANKEVYKQLSRENQNQNLEDSFFPKYRTYK